jgi:O-acetyl-ADP-ribose deacetylase (regulator of RNase III)
MTIRHTVGNILQSMSDAVAIPVNTVGVPGAGLALEAASAYPSWRDNYKMACQQRALQVGEVKLVCEVEPGKYLISFPTKQHWKNPSQLKWIDAGLAHLARNHMTLARMGIRSVALPMLGCGRGGLEWSAVRALIYKHFENHEMDIEVYGP